MKVYWAETDPENMIRKANLTSKNLKPSSKPWTPTDEWCRDIVLSQHSTSEWATLIFEGEFRSDVAHQLVRATAYHPRHVMASARPDWTGKHRNPDPAALRSYMSRWSIKAFLAMSQERLCRQAMKETRETVEAMKAMLMSSDDKLMHTVGWASVPICVYRCGCPFGKKSCEWWNRHVTELLCGDIEWRYDDYNKIFQEGAK